jgi:uncharacterized protein
MRFIREATSAINIVRAHGGGELRINDTVYRGAVILSAAALLHEPQVLTFEGLLSDGLLGADASRIMALDPEVLLLGTGARQIFAPAEFGARFLRKGIGIEVMDTGAACRTYNVLAAEQRRVVAVLLA